MNGRGFRCANREINRTATDLEFAAKRFTPRKLSMVWEKMARLGWIRPGGRQVECGFAHGNAAYPEPKTLNRSPQRERRRPTDKTLFGRKTQAEICSKGWRGRDCGLRDADLGNAMGDVWCLDKRQPAGRGRGCQSGCRPPCSLPPNPSTILMAARYANKVWESRENGTIPFEI